MKRPHPLLGLVPLAALALFSSGACGNAGGGAPAASTNATASAAPTASSTGATSVASVSSAAPPNDAGSDAAANDGGDAGDAGEETLPGTSEGCPDDMVMVEGGYCPVVDQKCLEHHDEYVKDEAKKEAKRAAGEDVEKGTVSERCLRYEEPSKCLSKHRQKMRFCVDRYEWPNKKGELPALLVSWEDARNECNAIGRRLCTEEEFNFACEGEAMLPYSYGYARDETKCNIDKPYRKREKSLPKYATCQKSPACKAELERLDQRVPAGSMPQCVSPFGVYDINGNVNEWVVRPKEEHPYRSGLKGGWWGPVRSRCRPTVGFHKEDDYGYEVGFRCCKDAARPKKD